MTYKRKSNTEWEWQKGTHHYSVRYFASTQKLIWGGWSETSNGPVFEEGFAQPVENFLQEGVSHVSPPQELLDDLREALTPKEKKGLFGWFKRGNK